MTPSPQRAFIDAADRLQTVCQQALLATHRSKAQVYQGALLAAGDKMKAAFQRAFLYEGKIQACRQVVLALDQKKIQEHQRALKDSVKEGIEALTSMVALAGTPGSMGEPQRGELPPAPLDNLRHLFQTCFPGLYLQILEPTLADIRQEHSDALTEGHPGKARWILLQGYCALAAAAACQLGSSLLGRIAALWQARSTK